MLALFGADGNLPFATALAVMLLLALLEGVGTLLGLGLSALIDALLPHVDLDVDAPDVDSPGVISGLLGWLYVGKVPFLVVMILLLTYFGVSGLLLQSFARSLFGAALPAALITLPAVVIAAGLTRASARTVARLLPSDETQAVSSASFVGRIATITLGTARAGMAAEARVNDQYGQHHYVRVEPEGGSEFPTGTEVLLVARRGSVFLAIPNPNPVLTDN